MKISTKITLSLVALAYFTTLQAQAKDFSYIATAGVSQDSKNGFGFSGSVQKRIDYTPIFISASTELSKDNKEFGLTAGITYIYSEDIALGFGTGVSKLILADTDDTMFGLTTAVSYKDKVTASIGLQEGLNGDISRSLFTVGTPIFYEKTMFLPYLQYTTTNQKNFEDFDTYKVGVSYIF